MPTTHPACPRVITSLTTWVYCFIAYCVIGTTDMQTRDHLTCACLLICRSKTDLFRVGVSLHPGITRIIIYPVKSMVAYLALSPKEDSSLFLWKDGSALSRDQLVKEVKVAVSKIGVDLKCYAGHSFQIRAAITGACVGIPPPPPKSTIPKCWVDGHMCGT